MWRQRKLCCVHKLWQCKVQKIAQFHNLCVLTCKKISSCTATVHVHCTLYSPKLAKSHHAWKIQATLHNLGILKLPSVWINQQWWCTTGRVAESGQTYKPNLEPDTPLNWSALSLFHSWLHHSPKVSHRRLVLEIKAEQLPALTL